ncbi:MAG: hypothetical protein H6657_20795 [Ardenticatenaceae bacterium]|nr:hypothetical protein [Anaerolineales bacterium]MCB8979856.1 hypothetical protein [Ardenticatenaceae bacterium]
MNVKPILLILLLLLAGCVQFDFDKAALERAIFGEPLTHQPEGAGQEAQMNEVEKKGATVTAVFQPALTTQTGSYTMIQAALQRQRLRLVFAG